MATQGGPGDGKHPRPNDLRIGILESGDERYLVLSHALPTRDRLKRLTAAEQDVLALLLRGLSNSEIARQRRTSVRTVANQVASIFRKLGVYSRSQLAALMSAYD